MNECCHLPLTKGINCLSSDRSQLTNVSIFGRLTQTVPVVVAFKFKYVLRFKLTARATCRGANKPGSGTKIKLTYDNQRWVQLKGVRMNGVWTDAHCRYVTFPSKLTVLNAQFGVTFPCTTACSPCRIAFPGADTNMSLTCISDSLEYKWRSG